MKAIYCLRGKFEWRMFYTQQLSNLKQTDTVLGLTKRFFVGKKMLTVLRRSKRIVEDIKVFRVYIETARRHLSAKTAPDYPRRIFSGIQPTGTVHLGNYLGAIKEWVRLQDSGEEVIWSIVDMHSITLPQNPEDLRQNIFKMAATLLACGIDPARSVLFQQSTVSMHAELGWVLSCMTTMPRLGQLPQFKEKSEKLKDIPLGLYIYPVLQTADILLYKATHVPVGQDQVQHLQLAQHLAHNFNTKFGQTFPLPRAIINETSGRIKSLRDPTKKMSKSSDDPKSRIDLTDTPEAILSKVKKAITDFTSEVTYEPESRPGVANLITLHSLASGKSPEEICTEVRGLDTGKYKCVVAEAIVEHLRPIRQRYNEFIDEPGYLESVLKDGAKKATEIAGQCWPDVREKIGFGNGIFAAAEKVTKVEAKS